MDVNIATRNYTKPAQHLLPRWQFHNEFTNADIFITDPHLVNSRMTSTPHSVSEFTSGSQFVQRLTAVSTTMSERSYAPHDFQHDRWTSWVGDAIQALRNRNVIEDRQPSTAGARLRVERLNDLQTVLGFTTLDLAKVLGIARQQLYKWFDSSKEIKLHGVSQTRLSIITEIAEEWRVRSAAPLSSVSHEILADGKTAFTLLAEDTISKANVLTAFDELINRLRAKPKTQSRLLSEAGFTRRASYRSLPSDE